MKADVLAREVGKQVREPGRWLHEPRERKPVARKRRQGPNGLLREPGHEEPQGRTPEAGQRRHGPVGERHRTEVQRLALEARERPRSVVGERVQARQSPIPGCRLRQLLGRLGREGFQAAERQPRPGILRQRRSSLGIDGGQPVQFEVSLESRQPAGSLGIERGQAEQVQLVPAGLVAAEPAEGDRRVGRQHGHRAEVAAERLGPGEGLGRAGRERRQADQLEIGNVACGERLGRLGGEAPEAVQPEGWANLPGFERRQAFRCPRGEVGQAP